MTQLQTVAADRIEELRSTHYNAEVVGVNRIHDDLMILRVRPDGRKVQFESGQYAILGLGHWEPRIEGTQEEDLRNDQLQSLAKRAYSIGCRMIDESGQLIRAQDDDALEFYINLVRQSTQRPPALTPRLFLLKHEDRLYLGPRFLGHYTLGRLAPDDTVVFVATGTGEAPHNTMLAELLHQCHQGHIVSVNCVRWKRDLAYRSTHRQLESRYANYRYLSLTTREPENLDPTLPGYVGKRYLQAYFASGDFERDSGLELDPGCTHVYLCGNPAMIGVPHHTYDPERRYPVPKGDAIRFPRVWSKCWKGARSNSTSHMSREISILRGTGRRRRSMQATTTDTRAIRRFDELTIDDVPLVGGKNASLGEMVRELGAQGVRVPDGFAVTAEAYRHFLQVGGLDRQIREILSDLNTADIENLRSRGSRVRSAILSAEFPTELKEAILAAYQELSKDRGGAADVAVRSSATAEDLPDASFAGQQETYLNVQGPTALLDACRRCFASLFTDRAISYRVDKGFDHFQVALSIGVQLMVRSDLSTSGVMFSIDTETGFPDVVLINAAYGLGENVVQGSVNPDEYYVFKPTLKTGFRPILRKQLGTKEFKLVYDVGGSKMVKNVPVSPEERARFALDDDDILTLARWAIAIEEHYSAKRGRHTPMDMEWAKDGQTGELFIVQARPETFQSQKKIDTLETYHLKQRGQVLVTGRSVGERIGQGSVRVIKSVHNLAEFQPGEVLVTDKTDPDWEPIMKKAAAIVTNRGGRTCHAAIVSRELGLPAIVGCQNATNVLETGAPVTASCAEGDLGYVYQGLLDYDVERVRLDDMRHPKTKIMMNVGNPEEAFRLAAIPNDGVGLARMEFIINNHIKIHPMALLEYESLEDVELVRKIDALTAGFENKPQFFIDMLAEGVAMIAAAFYPRDVIVRMSDFKSNEYANLIGGRAYEPVEENPMIGFRGASRYYDKRYREAFGLECQAMKKVREEMGLENVKLMIPFCRTVEEGRRVQEVMADYGLRRGEQGLEIYVMCELPSNVVAAAEFAKVFDGFSIGSNDLTQLILGVDRDSEIVAHVFDERDPAVMDSIAAAVRAAQAAGRKIGICGQAPSDYPEFAQFLVGLGIDSISLNPDAVMKTTRSVLQLEHGK